MLLMSEMKRQAPPGREGKMSLGNRQFRTSHAMFGVLLLITAGLAVAQNATVAPGVAVPRLNAAAQPPTVAAAKPSAVGGLVGSWLVTRTDQEEGRTHAEITLIRFEENGRYKTEILSSLLDRPAGRGSAGRFKISAVDEKGFILTIDRDLDDPLMDRKLTTESQRMTWLDADTLRSADGDIARRKR